MSQYKGALFSLLLKILGIRSFWYNIRILSGWKKSTSQQIVLSHAVGMSDKLQLGDAFLH